MQSYIVRRVGVLVTVFFGASIVIFFVMRVIPGDPAQIILGTEADLDVLERMREKLGLNRPLVMQYLDWLRDIFKGE